MTVISLPTFRVDIHGGRDVSVTTDGGVRVLHLPDAVYAAMSTRPAVSRAVWTLADADPADLPDRLADLRAAVVATWLADAPSFTPPSTPYHPSGTPR